MVGKLIVDKRTAWLKLWIDVHFKLLRLRIEKEYASQLWSVDILTVQLRPYLSTYHSNSIQNEKGNTEKLFEVQL